MNLVMVQGWRVISEAQLRDQLHRLGVRQCFEDIPALLSSGSVDGAQAGEVAGALHGAQAA